MARLGAVVALLCLLTGVAAADKARARLLFREATQHYKLREFPQALDAFKEAYRNFEDPSFLYNIAQCHRALGHHEEAIRFYRTFLHDVPNAPNESEVRALIASLEDEVQKENAAKQKAAEAAAAPAPAVAPAPASPSGNLVAAAPSSPPPDQPLYKKWWLWTAVGVVAVGVGVGVGLAVGLPGPSAPAVQSSLGTYHPSF